MWLVKQPSQVGGDGAWKQEGLSVNSKPARSTKWIQGQPGLLQ